MSSRPPRRPAAPGGFTLLELMIALVVLLVALTGFVGAANQSVTSTALAHRRTLELMLETGLGEELRVSPRSALQGYAAGTWILDACFDEHAHLVATNDDRSTTFECPTSATLPSTEVAIPAYRRWIQVNEVSDQTWQVSLYVERISGGCTPEHRDASSACVSSELLLND